MGTDWVEFEKISFSQTSYLTITIVFTAMDSFKCDKQTLFNRVRVKKKILFFT